MKKCLSIYKILIIEKRGDKEINQNNQENALDTREKSKILSKACWIDNQKGIGNRKMFELYKQFESIDKLYEASHFELCKYLSSVEAKELYERIQKYQESETINEKCDKCISIWEANYPKRLKEIIDPPKIIYCRGDVPREDRLTIAVIGARGCSDYGKRVAREIGSFLARNEIQLVSGLARGVDSTAQDAATGQGVGVYAVMGCGVNICYPKESEMVYNKIVNCGGILSEYPRDIKPQTYYFPARNRLISGLSDGLIVVEAKEKSGTMITVDMALEQGRDVGVIPGRITDLTSKGCNKLISQGAQIIWDLEEYIRYIAQRKLYVNQIGNSEPSKNNENKCHILKIKQIPNITTEKEGVARRIVKILSDCPKGLQELYERLSAEKTIDYLALIVLLSELEVMRVVEKNGEKYVLAHK